MARWLLRPGSVKGGTNRLERPLKLPDGRGWPVCRRCGTRMDFLFAIDLADREDIEAPSPMPLVLVFECGSRSSACRTWRSDLGGNAALACRRNPEPAMLETGSEAGEGTSAEESGLLATAPAAGKDTVDAYLEGCRSRKDVVGKLGGTPFWIQDDETPRCDCGLAMRFVAQIERRFLPGARAGDDGSGYVFVCETCGDRARYLWQCA